MPVEPRALTPEDTGDDVRSWRPDPEPLVEHEPPMHRPSVTRRVFFRLGQVPIGSIVENEGRRKIRFLSTGWGDRIELFVEIADLRFWIERLEDMRVQVEQDLMG